MTNPNQPKLTTTQTKAIAEALDGHRTGEIVHMVVEAEPKGRCDARPVPRNTVDPDVMANSLSDRRKKPYINVGEFQTESDPTLGGTGLDRHYAIILHEKNTAPFTLKGGFYGGFQHVKDIVVQFQLVSGEWTTPRSLRPPDTNDEDERIRTLPWVDAAFFSFAAVDKFVMPYYTRMYGAEEAAKLRAALAGDTMREREEFLGNSPALR